MHPRSILDDRLLASSLTWSEMEEMLLLMSEPPRRDFKSFRGLLDVDQLDDEVFRAMFRYRKEEFPLLLSGLRIPDKVTSAHGVAVTGDEALCIALRRLAYPNRWIDLEVLFGRGASILSSIATQVYRHIDKTFGILLSDLNAHKWLDVAELERMSRVRISYHCHKSNV